LFAGLQSNLVLSPGCGPGLLSPLRPAERAQHLERMRHIGVLMAYAESDPEGQAFVAAFRDGLQKLGWA